MGPRLQISTTDKPIAGLSQLIEDLKRLSESSETTGDIGNENHQHSSNKLINEFLKLTLKTVFLLGDEEILDRVYAHRIIMQVYIILLKIILVRMF